MKKSPILIAIDGPSASGKGTIARRLALYFNLPCLNTGALYRAVALRFLRQKITLEYFEKNILLLTKNIVRDDLENKKLFLEETGETASILAKNAMLRSALFELQRQFIRDGIARSDGAIVEGRDIASVIMPEANHKFFITADVEIRAKRRYNQLKSDGENIAYDKILMNLKNRDENDKTRKDSPLVVDKDAIIIDNGNLTVEETFAKILAHF